MRGTVWDDGPYTRSRPAVRLFVQHGPLTALHGSRIHVDWTWRCPQRRSPPVWPYPSAVDTDGDPSELGESSPSDDWCAVKESIEDIAADGRRRVLVAVDRQPGGPPDRAGGKHCSTGVGGVHG